MDFFKIKLNCIYNNSLGDLASLKAKSIRNIMKDKQLKTKIYNEISSKSNEDLRKEYGLDIDNNDLVSLEFLQDNELLRKRLKKFKSELNIYLENIQN